MTSIRKGKSSDNTERFYVEIRLKNRPTEKRTFDTEEEAKAWVLYIQTGKKPSNKKKPISLEKRLVKLSEEIKLLSPRNLKKLEKKIGSSISKSLSNQEEKEKKCKK